MDAHRNTAQILVQSADAFAAVASRQLRGNSDRYPSDLWRQHLGARLRELAACVRDDRPELFAKSVERTVIAADARALPLDDYRHALEVLKDVLLEELPSAGHEIIRQAMECGIHAFAAPPDAPASCLDGSPHTDLAARFLEGVLSGDRRRATEVLRTAVSRGDLSVKEAYLEVLIPAVQETGRLWFLGELSIAEEHFVSHTVTTATGQLLALADFEEPHGGVAVTAAVAGNAHDLGVRFVADLLEIQGWRAVCLGGDVPAEDLATLTSSLEADLICLSATLPEHRQTARHAIEALRSGLKESCPQVLVGGRGFEGDESLALATGADRYAASVEQSLAFARECVEARNDEDRSGSSNDDPSCP